MQAGGHPRPEEPLGGLPGIHSAPDRGKDAREGVVMPVVGKPVMGGRGVYLGIDPGMSGGLAALGVNGGVSITKMPATEADIWEWFQAFSHATFAVIEKVGGYISGAGGKGGGAANGSAMFKFGFSTGVLYGLLTAGGIPFEEVSPRIWQAELGILKRKKSESKTQWKNRLKALAQRLFPSVGVTLATADAILLAEYCRRLREGRLEK